MAAMRTGVSTGSNVSKKTSRIPVVSAVTTIAMPPMCAIGMANGKTSSVVSPRLWMTADAPAITDSSVCIAPLGAAVVPDE